MFFSDIEKVVINSINKALSFEEIESLSSSDIDFLKGQALTQYFEDDGLGLSDVIRIYKFIKEEIGGFIDEKVKKND